MRVLLIAVTVLTLTASLAHAGLVEVNSSTYYRESGSPATEFLEVTLDDAGEIRVANVNLQDDAIEPTAATEVVLNGSPLMQPFTLPTGGSTVFPLAAGTHTLEVTLAGKPGGGIRVSFYEDKPEAPEAGIGFEILDDGTVMHRKTGLIWHRNPQSPGFSQYRYQQTGRYDPYFSESKYPGGLEGYLSDFNAGVLGTDPVFGNAGHSDWRVPSFFEVFSLINVEVAFPPFSRMDGSFTPGVGDGDHFGKPFFICYDFAPAQPFDQDSECDTPYQENPFLWSAINTSTKQYGGLYYGVDIGDGRLFFQNTLGNGFLFVRGGQPE